MDPKTYETPLPLPITQLSQVPLVPQHFITSGTRKDCIRLRGLPYEAQVEHILEFLGEHAKNIVFQGVHMVYNAQVITHFAQFTQVIIRKVVFLIKTSKNEITVCTLFGIFNIYILLSRESEISLIRISV